MNSTRITTEIKQEILDLIKEGNARGVCTSRCCELLQIPRLRVTRWCKRPSLDDAKPGPLHAPHALLQEERESILSLAKDEKYINESHRILRARGADLNLFHVSETTVFRVMKECSMTTSRVQNTIRNGKSVIPKRKSIDGPNQRWCWDITYLPTNVKGHFLYLFLLLDEYSRKVISWRVSYNMIYREAMELLQEGLENEGLDDIVVALPDLINDRGSQMKAKPFVAMCKDLGINQQFSRPRTPNDNPFIESFFSIFKNNPFYPGAFIDDIAAITFCTTYVEHYNNDRLHGGIEFVTPNQKHQGEANEIILKRKKSHSKSIKKRFIQNKMKSLNKKPTLEVVEV